MRDVVTASAPGKVVLCGEYAVLDGAPAISMAVDRRARATLTVNGESSSVITSKGHTQTVGRFRLHGSRVEWQEGQDYFGIVDSVWNEVDVPSDQQYSIHLDSSDFVASDSETKLGIGSSAAITVALCAAADATADFDVLARSAQRAHADLQGGAGSGVDIASSLHGGLIEYRMVGNAATRLDWPDDLYWRLIWTGSAASTTEKISKLDAAVHKPSRVRLADASESMSQVWQSGSADRILSEYRHYIDQLREFSVDHELGIFDAGHDDIWRVAMGANLVYKPCGAGGGDVGIVFAKNDDELDAFTTHLAREYEVVDCQLSRTGVMIEDLKAERA